MATYTFTKVKYTATRLVNGKRQQKTFWQTINPFNKNLDGTPKTRNQIMVELKVEAAAWVASHDQ